MLLREEIAHLKLVQLENGTPAPDENYDITSYNLRLGAEFCLISASEEEQQVGNCSFGTGMLRIPPFACVLVSTEEVVKLPFDIAGRWGLKIRPAMSGLVFQAGPQIEPGSHTRLFGLLFNLSSSDRTLHHGQKLWSVDFERLDSPVVSLGAQPRRATLRMRDYTQNGLPFGSINEIYHEYRKLQKDASSRRDVGIAILMAVVTLLISLTVPVVVTRLVSDSTEIVRKQQELEDRIVDLERQADESATRSSPSIPTTSK